MQQGLYWWPLKRKAVSSKSCCNWPITCQVLCRFNMIYYWWSAIPQEPEFDLKDRVDPVTQWPNKFYVNQLGISPRYDIKSEHSSSQWKTPQISKNLRLSLWTTWKRELDWKRNSPILWTFLLTENYIGHMKHTVSTTPTIITRPTCSLEDRVAKASWLFVSMPFRNNMLQM